MASSPKTNRANPYGYRYCTDPWPANIPPALKAAKALGALDRIDEASFTAAVESLQPQQRTADQPEGE